MHPVSAASTRPAGSIRRPLRAGLLALTCLLSAGPAAVAQSTAQTGPASVSPAPVSPATVSPERAALEARLSALTTALKGDVCATPDAARALLAAGTPNGSAPAAKSPADKAAAPSQTEIKTNSTPGKPLEKAALVSLLKQAVVLIVAGENSGSGFIVDGNHIVTNNHVIAEADGKPVIVAGVGIGSPREAKIIAHVAEEGPAGRDFAVLQVSGPPLTTKLALTPTVADLQPIVAAGFPGLLITNDVQFHRLMQGDLSATPEIILSQGAVMAIQNRSAGMPTIAHNAPISGGNSGGPLVDACGRVVGINTYIRVASDQGTNAGYALGTEGLLKFLNKVGVSPAVQGGPCE